MPEEQFSDEELDAAIHPARPGKEPRIGATVMGECPDPDCTAYGKPTPVSVKPDGQTQVEKCVVCGGMLRIDAGKHGKKYEENRTAPTDTEADQ